jgi:hypothetical protein
MDLSSVNKRSTRSLVFTAIFFWFFGGYYLADGIHRLVQTRLAYRWPGSFLLCLAYLGVGILYTVMLLRRIPSDSRSSRELPNASIQPPEHSATQ